MAHSRIAVRKLLEASLRAMVPQGVAVTQKVQARMPLPSLQVMTVQEDSETTMQLMPSNRNARLDIIIRCGGTTCQDQCDELAEVVEEVVPSLRSLDETRNISISYRGMDFEVDAEQSEPVGTMTLHFDAMWAE